jgi:hypothetical protein
MTFRVEVCRVRMRALERVVFPRGKAGNVVRGAFGLMLARLEEEQEGVLAEWFAPQAESGPSGYADQVRPYVVRAEGLDGLVARAGTEFAFGVHLFRTGAEAVAMLERAFAQVAEEGIGVGRGRAELVGIERRQVTVEWEPRREARRVEVVFLTPTELKAGGQVAGTAEFGVLMRRVRDRVARLAAVYGEGCGEVDYRGLGERADGVRLVEERMAWQERTRRSGRTGQVHPLGGFTGRCVYEGELGEFLPWLEAAQWTGVGRQTVWGKGAVAVRRLE